MTIMSIMAQCVWFKDVAWLQCELVFTWDYELRGNRRGVTLCRMKAEEQRVAGIDVFALKDLR